MLGNLGNLAGLLKSAKEMQAQFGKLQEELAAKRFDGDAGGGMGRVTVNGKGTLLSVKIDPKAAGDIELLEDMIKAAVAAAAAKSQEAMKSELASLTGGMNLPGLTDLLGPAATS